MLTTDEEHLRSKLACALVSLNSLLPRSARQSLSLQTVAQLDDCRLLASSLAAAYIGAASERRTSALPLLAPMNFAVLSTQKQPIPPTITDAVPPLLDPAAVGDLSAALQGEASPRRRSSAHRARLALRRRHAARR